MDKKIGQLIKQKVKEQNIGITDFAKMINKERSNVYHIFTRESLDTDLLKKIGHILNYDFFQHFLEPETVQKIIIKDKLKTSKFLVELELSEDEIKKLGFEDRIVKILNK